MNSTRILLSLVLLGSPAFWLPWVSRARRPAAWALVSVLSLGAGFVLFLASLFHAALPWLFDGLGLRELALACRKLGGHLFGAAAPFSAFAGLLSVVIMFQAARGLRRLLAANRILHGSQTMGTNGRIGGFQVVSLPVSERLALAVPGGEPKVLISRGVLRELPLDETAAVLRHEMAHLRLHHKWFLLLGTLVRSGLWFAPGVKRSERVLHLALERWADEEAAGGRQERWAHLNEAIARLSPAGGHTRGLWEARLAAAERSASGAPGIGEWSWWLVAAAVIPIVITLAASLVLHLEEVFRVASG